MPHRYKTDENCPRPGADEERRIAGRFSIGVVVFILAMLAISAYLSSIAEAAIANVYWRVDLHQGSGIIAYAQGSTEQGAWDDCFRMQAITWAMTAAETRKASVGAVTTTVVRWCQNPRRYANVSPDPATCPAAPAPKPGTCPAGTTGSWTQTATVGPAPTCTVTWSTAPTGACIPISVEPIPSTGTISWTKPATNDDGTPFTDLAWYLVHYGTTATAQVNTIRVPANNTTFQLPRGTWYCSVRAVNSTDRLSIASATLKVVRL